MASKKKKNNALKWQLYGTPLPLPCLQQRHQEQQHQQQQPNVNQQVPQQLRSTNISTALQPTGLRCSWTPLTSLDALLTVFRHMLSWTSEEICNLCSGGPSRRSLIHAEFHPQAECVWVKREKDMETLFRQGFFGKGTLSRSEATWNQRNASGAQGISLEEITRQRRIDRALLKQEKKLQQQQGVLTPLVSSPTQQSSPTTIGSNQTPSPSASPAITARATPRRVAPEGSTEDREDEENYEHLQLSMEEAFFLVFAVECITLTGGAVTTTTSVLEQDRYHSASALSIRDCWLLFSEASTLHKQRLSLQSVPTVRFELEPDNPFITRYVVYHYYRSQGWIVKDGLKYGTDYLLYQKGVVFGHSQYAVKIIHGRNERDPTLSAVHPQLTGSRRTFISSSPGLCLPNAALSWQWLLTLNRVIAQVQKTVILCHVLLPTNISKHQLLDPRTALPLYTVAEIGVKRFIPERNRV